DLWAALTELGFPEERRLALIDDMVAAWSRWTALLCTDDDAWGWWLGDQTHWTQAWRQDSPAWTREVEQSGGRRFRDWGRLSGFLAPVHEAGLDELAASIMSGDL